MKLFNFLFAVVAAVALSSCTVESLPEKPEFSLELKSIAATEVLVKITPREDVGTYYISCMKKDDFTGGASVIADNLSEFEFLSEYYQKPIAEIISSKLNEGEAEIKFSYLFPSTEYIIYVYQLSGDGKYGEVTVFEFVTTEDGFGFDVEFISITSDNIVANVRVSDQEIEYCADCILVSVVEEYGSLEAYLEWFYATYGDSYITLHKGDFEYSAILSDPDSEYYFFCYAYSDGKIQKPIYIKSFYSGK